MTRRVAPILMIVVLAALGSGALQALHEHAHQLADAGAHDECHGHEGATPHDHPTPPHHHDETNCELHALLRAPIVSAGPVAVLICLGLFVAFLTMVEPPLASRRVPLRCDCRGPPSR